MENLEKNKHYLKIKSRIYLDNFIKEHKERLRIIKQINKQYNNRNIIFQLCILGIESLSKYYKPKANKIEKKRIKNKGKRDESGWRFILLMSKIMKRKEAEEFYKLFRCSYIHVGFPNPFLDYEGEDNQNLSGISQKDLMKFFRGQMKIIQKKQSFQFMKS